MTIRRKILFSNITMLLLLLALLLAVSFFIVQSFIESYNTYAVETVNNGQKSISSHKLQLFYEKVVDMVKNNEGDICACKDYPEALSFLDTSGSMLAITVDSKPLYVTEGFTYDEILNKEGILFGDMHYNGEQLYYADSDCFLLKTRVQTSSGSEAEILLFNTDKGISGVIDESDGTHRNLASSNIKNSIMKMAFSGIVIIVIINFILVILVSNSIMKPLNNLKEGTKLISEGNLDFEITYYGDDELAEVISNFEVMRRKLAESTERQRKYEEDRKELIAGISHDLRTPLTSIKGYVSGLIDGIADSPEKQERYLRTIYNTATDMDKLVEDLFLFSKLDLRKIPFQFEKVDIVKYLALCAEELKFDLEKRKVVLTYTPLCASPVYVMLDRDQFGRVLLNIANNTVKYKVNDIGSLQIMLSFNEDVVRIVLKDDGSGMEKELVSRVFESFYRRDPARTNPVGGSGLGLSIAKQIVENHDGVISAESNIGEGMSIIIELPVYKDEGGVGA